MALSTTPEITFGLPTMNDTDYLIDDDDLTSSSSSYTYDNTAQLLIEVPIFSIYALGLLIGVTGNLLVIFAVAKSRRLHNVTCLFLANLAVADLLTVVFLIPLQITVHFMGHWTLGDAMCRIATYFHVVSPVCSVFTMVIISLERYYVVLHPLQAKSFITMGRAKRVVVVLWVASYFFSSPALFSKKEHPVFWEGYSDPVFYSCHGAWASETLSTVYTIYLLLLLLVVPLIVMSYAYIKLACNLYSTRERSIRGTSNGSPFAQPSPARYRVWYRNTSGWSSGSSFVRRNEVLSRANGVTIDDDVGSEAEALRSPPTPTRSPSRVDDINDSPAPRRHSSTGGGDKIQRVVTMLAIVVALYIISWAPLLTYHVISHFTPGIPRSTDTILTIVFHLIAACNSCINPLIYAFLSKNFRQSFKQVIRDCCCSWPCFGGGSRTRLAYQPSIRWTRSSRTSYSYAPPGNILRGSPQRSTVSQKTDV